MNLDELQSVQSRERQTDQLQQLRATFYEEAGQFIQQLREERERAAERADDPFDSPEVNRLTDDIKTAEQTVEAVYERRVGKIVKMASLAAADMPTEDDGLTQEERDLFETMVTAIESNRSHVLDVIAGEAPTGAVGDGETTSESDGPTPPQAGAPNPSEPAETTEPGSGVGAADVMGGEQSPPAPPEPPDAPADDPPGEAGPGPAADAGPPEATDRDDGPAPPEEPGPETDGGTPAAQSPEPDRRQSGPDAPTTESAPADDGDVERRMVRITDDVGEIFGVDQREYDLSTDDVVTLPADNADPLVERDAAEPLE